MKNFKKWLLLPMLAMLVLASCKKDEISQTDIVPTPSDPSVHIENGLITRSVVMGEGLDLGCLSIDYPFGLLLMDSTSITVSSEEEALEAFTDTLNYPINYVYPLNVTLEDGTTQTVNNADELAALFADCVPDTGWGDDYNDMFFPAWVINSDNSCYELVYPVTVLNIDSSATVANTEDELVALLADGNIYSFAFPLSLLHENGNTVTADDPDALFDLLPGCGPNTSPGGFGIGTFACYQLGYPATIMIDDINSVIVNNDDEFANVAMTTGFVGFDYPITLIDENGSELVVNSNQELDEAIFSCASGNPGQFGDFACYNFIYPLTIRNMPSGTIVTINGSSEWLDYVSNLPPGGDYIEFVFPVSFTHFQTNEIVTAFNEDELGTALEGCY